MKYFKLLKDFPYIIGDIYESKLITIPKGSLLIKHLKDLEENEVYYYVEHLGKKIKFLLNIVENSPEHFMEIEKLEYNLEIKIKELEAICGGDFDAYEKLRSMLCEKFNLTLGNFFIKGIGIPNDGNDYNRQFPFIPNHIETPGYGNLDIKCEYVSKKQS